MQVWAIHGVMTRSVRPQLRRQDPIPIHVMPVLDMTSLLVVSIVVSVSSTSSSPALRISTKHTVLVSAPHPI